MIRPLHFVAPRSARDLCCTIPMRKHPVNGGCVSRPGLRSRQAPRPARRHVSEPKGARMSGRVSCKTRWRLSRVQQCRKPVLGPDRRQTKKMNGKIWHWEHDRQFQELTLLRSCHQTRNCADRISARRARCLRPCKVFGPNRTKMFHVKHFGTIQNAACMDFQLSCLASPIASSSEMPL
jgi:hypothetical protein